MTGIKKGKAYESLMGKSKEIDKNANREKVVKKINSLRSVYRKEVAKVNEKGKMKLCLFKSHFRDHFERKVLLRRSNLFFSQHNTLKLTKGVPPP